MKYPLIIKNGEHMKNLFYYLRKTREMALPYLIATLCRNLFSALLSLFNIAGFGMVVDALYKKSYASVIRTIIFFVALNFLIDLCEQLLGLFENRAMRRASNVLQYQYMRDCLDIDYHYVQDGNMLNLKRKSMIAHPAFSLNTFGEFFGAIVRLSGTLTVFFLLDPSFVALLILLSGLNIAITLHTQKLEHDFRIGCTDGERKLDQLYEIMTQYKFAKEIRVNNASGLILSKYRSIFSDFLNKFKSLRQKKLGAEFIGILLSCLQSAVMYLFFTYKTAQGEILISEYTVAVSSTALFTAALLSLFMCIGTMKNILKSVDIYRDYENTVGNNCRVRKLKSIPEKDIDPRKASLVFDNVTFRYPGSDHDTLKNISFSLAPGEKLAVVGLNGAGKTTVIKLILRLYKPSAGQITLGGYDIWEINSAQYTALIGTVLQDFHLFAYSVKENIVFDKEYDPIRLAFSIERCGLGDKIRSLPRGNDTYVYRILDDSGVEFSGGEGQKLAAARAIYKDSAFFLLDEATSSLDPITEATFFAKLCELTSGKSTIFITHRLKSTTLCDRILVIKDGEIVENGTHDLLLQSGGIYAKLYNSQVKYYADKPEN